MRKNKFFTLFILLCIIWGCSNNQKKENDVTKTPQKDVYNLIGKRVTSIDSIVSNKTCRFIFLFNYYDCGSCIDLGFSITKKIDSLYRNNKVAIISTMGSPSSFQKRNKYYEYIYLDSKDLIRKELKYVISYLIMNMKIRLLYSTMKLIIVFTINLCLMKIQ